MGGEKTRKRGRKEGRKEGSGVPVAGRVIRLPSNPKGETVEGAEKRNTGNRGRACARTVVGRCGDRSEFY